MSLGLNGFNRVRHRENLKNLREGADVVGPISEPATAIKLVLAVV